MKEWCMSSDNSEGYYIFWNVQKLNGLYQQSISLHAEVEMKNRIERANIKSKRKTYSHKIIA